MKEVIEAAQLRIKTPYFGYAVLAFLGLNWRGIFLLATTEGLPESRLAAFDSVTSINTLLVFPLIVGAFVSASAQWIKFLFSWISRKPLELIDNLDLEAEHRKTIRHSELEQSRSDLFAVKEKELIERAQRDEDVANIEDAEAKERLTTQLDALRRERDLLTAQLENEDVLDHRSAANLTKDAWAILRAAAGDANGTIIRAQSIGSKTIQAGKVTFGDGRPRDFARYDEALNDLVDFGFVIGVGEKGEVFNLTHAGWKAADEL